MMLLRFKKIKMPFLKMAIMGNLFLISTNLWAVTIDAGNVRFGINGYFDLETTWMDEMSMPMACSSSAPCLMNGMVLTSGNMLSEMPHTFG